MPPPPKKNQNEHCGEQRKLPGITGNQENLIVPLLVHKLLGPKPPPPPLEAQVLLSRCDTLGGAGGGVRALYICAQLYIDELSPTNPLIPSIALASRT